MAIGLGGCARGGWGVDFEGRYERAAVAADHALASRAGAEILRAGGNAVDAAVATSFTLAVVRPHSCGIGGGGFMVIHLPDDPAHGAVTTTIDYRETAPAAVGPDFYADGTRSSTRGGTAVGVPGTVAGLLHALDTYGTMDRADVLAPAIRAAEEGFVVDEHYARGARRLLEGPLSSSAARDRFGFVWGMYLRAGTVEVGDRIRNPCLAETLRLIAADGADAFYEGPIGEAVVEAVRADGGVLRREDLAGYEVREAEPIRFRFFEYELLGMPPPSSGGVVMAEILGLLERELAEPAGADRGDQLVGRMELQEDLGRPSGFATHVSRLAEAFKHAFADRARWLGDPAYVDVPIGWLLDAERLDALAADLEPGEPRPPEAYGSAGPPPADAGTSHFCVVDRWGGAVSCTETINLTFGSLVGVTDYGFVLNDEMDDFTARPGEPNAFGLVQSAANAPAPGKRPLSSMSPTIVLGPAGRDARPTGESAGRDARPTRGEGARVFAVAGASGGPRIITGTTQVLFGAMSGWADGYMAMMTPRAHHQWLPDVLFLEPPFFGSGPGVDGGGPGGGGSGGGEPEAGTDVLDALRGMGYEVQRRRDVGNVQLIVRDGRRWQAVCDPRKGGEPAGW